MSQSEKEEDATFREAEYKIIDGHQFDPLEFALLAADVDARRKALDVADAETIAQHSAKSIRVAAQIIPSDEFTHDLVDVLKNSSALALSLIMLRGIVSNMHEEIERLKSVVAVRDEYDKAMQNAKVPNIKH